MGSKCLSSLGWTEIKGINNLLDKYGRSTDCVVAGLFTLDRCTWYNQKIISLICSYTHAMMSLYRMDYLLACLLSIPMAACRDHRRRWSHTHHDLCIRQIKKMHSEERINWRSNSSEQRSAPSNWSWVVQDERTSLPRLEIKTLLVTFTSHHMKIQTNKHGIFTWIFLMFKS